MSRVNREKGYGVVTLVKLVDKAPFFPKWSSPWPVTSYVLCSFFVLSDVTQLYTPVQAGMTAPSNLQVQAMKSWVGLNLMSCLNLNNEKIIIAGFQCHAIQNRSKIKSKPFNRKSPESEKRKKVLIQRLWPWFRSQQVFLREIYMLRNFLPKFILGFHQSCDRN